MARRGTPRPVSRTSHRGSLDEIGEAAPTVADSAANPTSIPESVTPTPQEPIDLSASARALEERQIRWIRLRERWESKRAKKEMGPSQGAAQAENSSAPPPGP